MYKKKYLEIVEACEGDLKMYGDSYLGVGWTKKKEYADTRYKIMLEVIKKNGNSQISLLDFGCGASHLYEYIVKHNVRNISYSGLDLSEMFLELSKRKFPHLTYYHLDVLDDNTIMPNFDYVVLNGLFNYKGYMSFEEMFSYFQDVVTIVCNKARIGMAFNVMSKIVDWERDDLFHLPFDMLSSFLSKSISRYFIIRHDYGLYEYTVYVYNDIYV